MPFSDADIEIRFHVAEGKCECARPHPQHQGTRCNKPLIWEKRGQSGPGAWTVHHKDGNNCNDDITNCQIVCQDCHSMAS